MKKSGKLNRKKLFISIALILFFVPGVFAIYSGVHHAIGKYNNTDPLHQKIIFAEKYPFETADADSDLTPPTTKTAALFNNYLDRATILTSYIEKYSGKNNIFSPFFFYMYGKTTTALGKKLTDDAEEPVIRLANGYLSYPYLYSQTPEEYAALLNFNEWLSGKNIPFLPVITANKSDDRHAVYPKGFPHGYAEKENEYTAFLADNGISYLNSREILLSENDDFFSWFYRTDHHWNVHAGFSVASAVAERLKTEFGLSVDTDILNRNRFSLVQYKKASLGSQGKKVTHGYIPPEDFEVYYPLFDTSFSLELPTLQLARTDSFENTLIDSGALKSRDYYLNKTYDAFLYEDAPLITIHNLQCKNDTRILMIKESNANVVDTYLAFSVEHLDIIDPRYFDGSIRTFIEKTRPDAVLTCTCPPVNGDSRMWDLR